MKKNLTRLQWGHLMPAKQAGTALFVCSVPLAGEISEFFPVHEKLFLVFSLFPLRQSLLCLRWSLEHERFGGPPGEEKLAQTNNFSPFLTFLFMASFFFVPCNTFRFAEIT